MSAVKRANARSQEALRAGSLELVDEEANAHNVDGPMLVGLHAGASRDEIEAWAVDFAEALCDLIARDVAEPMEVLVGGVTQAMLLGVFLAQEGGRCD